MDIAMQRFGFGPRATFSLIFIFAVSLSAVASAQEGGGVAKEKSLETEMNDVIAEVETRRVEINELAKKIEESSDRAAAVIMEDELSSRREDYRREVEHLVELVLEGEETGADVVKGRETATKVLEADAPKMKESLVEERKVFINLVDTIANGTPEEVSKAQSDLVDEIKSSTRLLKYLKKNVDLRQSLGLDVESDVAWMKDYLKSRADFTSGMLKEAKQKIDDIASRSGVDKDPEAQKRLVTLRKQRTVLAESQRVTADLMDAYGMQTAQIRRGIISATGKLSEDILDAKVATGLAESMAADSVDWLRTNGAQLIFQIVTFFLVLLAFWIAARIGRSAVRRGLDRSKLDISSLAKEFFIKSTGRLIMLIGVIIAVAQVGVEVGPLLAGLGIAGFVVGFALQDTLSNFASGMMILVYRPFDVGDAIEAGGVTGKVDQMNLVSTMILTFDNQLLIVPNKQVWGGIIRNITHQDKRRVDMTFGIGYSDDIPKAEKVLTEIVTSHEKVLKDPEPVIRLHNLGESSVDFVVRPWSLTDDYWDVYWDVTREVKRRFDEDGISIPFPQRDIHVFHDNANGDAPSVDNVQHSNTSESAQTPVPGEEDDDV
jgi:small-conductance mechanosensitive channel